MIKEFILNPKKVTHIEKIKGEHDVYSIETKHTHTFMTSNHLMIHNCLPKDTKALLSYAKDLGVEMPVLQSANDYNDKLVEKQGLKPLEIK